MTRLRRMRPPAVRRPLSLTLAGALAAAGTLAVSVVGASTPATASQATASTTFTDCEVRFDPSGVDQKVLDNVTWTTPVRLNHPSPVPTDDEFTVETEFGPTPANIIPEPLTELYVTATVEFTSGLQVIKYNRYYPTFDPSQPLVFPEIETETYWSYSGIYDHGVKSVDLRFVGTNASDEYAEYTFGCDQQVNPQTLLSTAVYDVDVAPTVTAAPYETKQGRKIRVVGTDFLTVAPTTPAAQVDVTIGGVLAGRYPVDQSGAFDAIVTVPPFTPPGDVQVRVTNSPKSASAPVRVKAVGAVVKATTKKIKPGKLLTLKGSAFKPGEKVKITLKGGKGKGAKKFGTSVRANGSGAFTQGVKLKKAAKGSWRITAAGSTSKRAGRSGFKVG